MRKQYLFLLVLALALAAPAGKAWARDPLAFREHAGEWKQFQPMNSKARSMPFLGNGKVRLVFFWATWCPYCKKAMLEILPRYTQWLEKGAEIYVVSIDDTKEAVEKFLQDNPMRLAVYWGGPKAKSFFRVHQLPTIFLLDEDNVVKSSYGGYTGERFGYLRKRLGSILKYELE